MTENVVLGLGSNRSLMRGGRVYSPCGILSAAVRRLETVLSDMRVSSVYRTKAMYVTGQDDFYNMAVCGRYGGSPRELLEAVGAVEAEFGRDRNAETPKGPRTLDIDIELFGNMCVDEPDLHIPHALLRERQFVLVPMLEIWGECAEPVTGEKYADILSRLDDQSVARVGVCPACADAMSE